MSRPQVQNNHPAPAGTETPTAPERRRAPRQTLVARVLVRSEASLAPVTTGFTSNISMLGVGLHTRRSLPVGEMFLMRVEAGPMQWTARLRVVSCKLHGGTWDVGAEFLEADSAAAPPLAMAA